MGVGLLFWLRIRDFMLNTNKKNPNALSGFFSSHVINPNRSQGSYTQKLFSKYLLILYLFLHFQVV